MRLVVCVAVILLASQQQLAIGGSVDRADDEQSLLLAKLLTKQTAQTSSAETVELLEKLDQNYYIAGQLRVGKLLDFQQHDEAAACTKNSLIVLRSNVQQAERLSGDNLPTALSEYLEHCERERIIKCSQRLPDPNIDLGSEIIERVSTGQNSFEQKVNKLSARQLLSGLLNKEQFVDDCRKLRDTVQVFKLVYVGAQKYALKQVLAEHSELSKWSQLFNQCDRLLHRINPYELRWT